MTTFHTDRNGDVNAAVDSILFLCPPLARYRADLAKLAQLGWRNEPPEDFYFKGIGFLVQLPWLRVELQKTLSAEFLQIADWLSRHADYSRSKERRERWPGPFADPPAIASTEFEGILWLSKLHWPGAANDRAHRLLRRVLDQVSLGVPLGSTRRLNRHPLKDVLRSIGKPQTREALADALAAVLARIQSTYPRVAQFLEEAFLPMICRRPAIWSPPADLQDDDLLGADGPPQPPGQGANTRAPAKPIDVVGRRVAKAFERSDLALEIIALFPELAPHSSSLDALSSAWRGEHSWDFFQTVGRLAYWAKWLQPFLENWAGARVSAVLRSEIKEGPRMLGALRKVHKWREQNYLEGVSPCDNKALLAGEGSSRDPGLRQLKALLLLGRLMMDGQLLDEERVFEAFITDIERAFFDAHHAGPSDVPTQRRLVLKDQINHLGSHHTGAAFAQALGELVPDISALFPHAGRVLTETFIPLLGPNPTAARKRSVATPTEPPAPNGNSTTTGNAAASGQAAPNGQPKPSRNRAQRKRPGRAAAPRVSRVRIPTSEPPQPGESAEETSNVVTAVRRPDSAPKPVSLRNEIRWSQQCIWGRNPLLVRDHIESLTDAEAFAFAKALAGRITSDIAERRLQSGWLGILTAMTLLTGRHVSTWTAPDLMADSGAATSDAPRLVVTSGVFEIPVIQPDDAFDPAESETMSEVLEPAMSTLNLSLPPSLCEWLRQLLKLGPAEWEKDAQALQKSIEAYVAELAPSVGTGISLSRVRLVARSRIREQSEDLAATMVLCGDTFGLSTAPLYYASLRRGELEGHFRKATWPLFGDKPSHHAAETRSRDRVGSRLLPVPGWARQLARSVGAPLYAPGKKASKAADRVRADHNHLVNHCLCMLLAVAGHRPTSPLLGLRRFDFDTTNHCAIFRDKQMDAAHLFRFVPIANIVSEQLDAYLEHLRGMLKIDDLPEATLEVVRGALRGTGPLFVFVNEDLLPAPRTLQSWSESLPNDWRVLPLNWGRTWLSSRGRDIGIKPDHLAILLGHLEAVGYPFSRLSPLEPAELSRQLAAPLGRLARESGWLVRRGLQSTKDASPAIEELGVLQDWQSQRYALAALVRDYEARQRLARRSAFRDKRCAGEATAHEALTKLIGASLPSFEAIRTPGKAKWRNSPQLAHEAAEAVVVSREDLAKVQADIDARHPTDAVVRIAAQNALHRYLKAAKRRLKWNCEIPSPWLAPPAMEPTPFFAGALRAAAQLNTLRQTFSDIPPKAPVGSPISGFEWRCGITALSLCLFGFVDRPELVRNVLQARARAERSKTIDDLLLVETDAGVIGLRGLAAVAVAQLQRQFPNEAVPDANRLDEILAVMLPGAIIGISTSALSRVCGTVATSNLIELSGLARLALDPVKGAVAMSTRRQRQFLEEGSGTGESAPARPSAAHAEVALPKGPRGKKLARMQYRQLIGILNIGEGPKRFELTDFTLNQANIVAFRQPLIAELRAYLASSNLCPLVRCIAAFAMHLTEHGTREKREPAPHTVYSYITSFGEALVELAGELDFPNLEEEEYIDLYQDVLDGKAGEGQRSRAARETFDFHAYLQAHHDFIAVDFSEIEGAPLRAVTGVDSEVIQPQEFRLGLEVLARRAGLEHGHDTLDADGRRLMRQSEVFSLLIRASGARLAEVAALRYRDLLANADTTLLLIRPSRYRRLKTTSARRVVDLTRRLSRAQRKRIAEWIHAEKLRLGPTWKPTQPIFSPLTNPRARVYSAQLRDNFLNALDAAGVATTRIHRARHLVVNEKLLSVWLSLEDRKALQRSALGRRRRWRNGVIRRIALPRDIQRVSLEIGHRHSSTTVANYFHMTWAATSRPHQALSSFSDRHTGAVALGLSATGADKIIQRSANATARRSDWNAAWLTHVVGEASPTPCVAEDSHAGAHAASRGWPSSRILERVLKSLQRGVAPTPAGLAHGLTSGQIDALRIPIAEVEHRMGLKIWPNETAVEQSSRRARAFQAGKALDGIFDLIDRNELDADRQLMIRIAQSQMNWAQKGSRDRFVWPLADVQRLSTLLAKLGVGDDRFQADAETAPPGFASVRVLRKSESSGVLNWQLSWLLIVTYVAARLRGME